MDRLLVAKAISRTPGSSEFKLLLSSSNKYGITDGNEKSDYISLTLLGQRITKPVNEQEKLRAIQEAVLTPELISKILRHYNRNKLPQGSFFHNTLERTFAVAPEHTEELAKLLLENGRFANLVENVSGSEYIRIDDTELVLNEDSKIGTTEFPKEGKQAEVPASPHAVVVEHTTFDTTSSSSETRQIFVAHGKNHAPMEQLTKILNEFKIPFMVAVNEANAGRPISQKIAEAMRASSAAIFVFTKDEEFVNKNGETVWRPSENVVYELGAASFLYGSKIIIFKEEGVKFASDFQDLGYITFAPNDIGAKTLELLRELIALNFIQMQAV